MSELIPCAVDKLRKDDRFSKLVKVLEEVLYVHTIEIFSDSQNRGLRDDLEEKNVRLTFFAPTNEAFDKLKKRMNLNKEREFSEIIRYHIVNHEFKEEDIFDGMTLRTDLKLRELNGQPQRIRVFEYEGDFLLVSFDWPVRSVI